MRRTRHLLYGDCASLSPSELTERSALRTLKELPVFQYKSGQDGPDECALCLEEFVDDDWLRSLPCRHSFHEHCIDRWFSSGVCRAFDCSIAYSRAHSKPCLHPLVLSQRPWSIVHARAPSASPTQSSHRETSTQLPCPPPLPRSSSRLSRTEHRRKIQLHDYQSSAKQRLRTLGEPRHQPAEGSV